MLPNNPEETQCQITVSMIFLLLGLSFDYSMADLSWAYWPCGHTASSVVGMAWFFTIGWAQFFFACVYSWSHGAGGIRALGHILLTKHDGDAGGQAQLGMHISGLCLTHFVDILFTKASAAQSQGWRHVLCLFWEAKDMDPRRIEDLETAI